MPDPIGALYDWVAANGFVTESAMGGWVGALDRSGRFGATTHIELSAPIAVFDDWMGDIPPAHSRRLLPFALCGGDGSEAAFWVDEEGEQRIVHLGSGSGSMMACVLAADAIDFLRLLAIGYPEICWPEDLVAPPSRVLGPAQATFRRWVETTFQVAIPPVGTDIVRHLSEYGDVDSPDPFNRWLQQVADPEGDAARRNTATRERDARRAAALPELQRRSRSLLESLGRWHDGQRTQGRCASCGVEGELRACAEHIVLCWECYWAW